MGTIARLSAPYTQRVILQKGFERLLELEKSLSSYDTQALIYKLNSSLHVKLNDDTYEALELSKLYYKQSSGYFDITIGSITKDAYRFGEDENIPSVKELNRSNIGFNALVFNENEATLLEGYKVDLGGMGKGFGVDKVYKLYRDADVRDGEISLSGDIRCIAQCTVEIKNPFGKGVIARVKSIKRGLAISTSGNYRRYIGSIENNHLINPKRKRSADIFASITLFSYGSNADLDAYATAASVMPKEKALAFLDSLDLGYIIYLNTKEAILSNKLSHFVRRAY